MASKQKQGRLGRGNDTATCLWRQRGGELEESKDCEGEEYAFRQIEKKRPLCVFLKRSYGHVLVFPLLVKWEVTTCTTTAFSPACCTNTRILFITSSSSASSLPSFHLFLVFIYFSLFIYFSHFFVLLSFFLLYLPLYDLFCSFFSHLSNGQITSRNTRPSASPSIPPPPLVVSSPA